VQPLDQRAFLQQVQNIRDLLKDFERDTQEVSQLHSRLLDAADSSSSSDLGRNLQNIEANVLSRNDQIRRQILKLAQDAANTTDSAKSMKHTQIGPLKKEFQNRITVYQEEEKRYRTNRQEQARRQFLIVNPDATDAELAAVADYSSDAQSEGIFQMAVSIHPTRSGTGRRN
jgi:syntaxin 1B/2/3